MRHFIPAIVALCIGSPFASASTIDVDFLPNTSGGGSNGLLGVTFQTFTAGVTGTLTQLDLRLYASGVGTTGNSGVEVSILSTTDGLPDARLDTPNDMLTLPIAPLGVASQASSPDGLNSLAGFRGAFNAFDFSGQGVALQSGSLYAIMVRQTDMDYGTLVWANKSDVIDDQAVGAYSGGQGGAIGFASSRSLPQMTDRTDYVFRTYMQPAVVPLPAALVLLLSGFGAITLTRWRHLLRRLDAFPQRERVG